MNKKYKLKLTPFALCSTIITLIVALFLYIGVVWLFSNVDFNTNSEIKSNSKKPMILISESMEPTIMTNSLLIVSNEPYYNIKKSDIILINTEKHGLVIHRVIEETEEGFITKGDNNLYADNWTVTKEMYKGKVEKIYNQFSNIITFLFGDFTQITSIRLIIGFVIIALIIAYTVLVINWLYDFIFVTYFLRKSNKKGEIKGYFNWMDDRTSGLEISEVVKELNKKRPFIQEILFRYRLMKWYNVLKEEEKQVKKVLKRYKKLKGMFEDE